MTQPRVTVHCIGQESEPVAVIEHFAPDPAALRAAAIAARFDGAGQHYPGIRAAVPSSYLAEVRALLGPVFREVFGVSEAVSVLDVRFSIVTTPPAALSLEQRLPHVDALDTGQLALVHYLGCGDESADGEGDGTAFYRHRSTGFETIDQGRSARYFAALNADLRRHGMPPPAYLHGDTPVFERIGHFAGRYNRALVYRGRLLHCGAISPDAALPADAATGRVTVTGFFAAR